MPRYTFLENPYFGNLSMKMDNQHKPRRLREDFYLLGIVVALLLVGSLGYSLLEGWTFFEGLYMTVITLSTVGYGEVQPLTQTGRLFTVLLIIGGVGVAGYVLTNLVSDLFDRQFNAVQRRRRMLEKIQLLDGHTIFCGFGRLAQVAVRELVSKKNPVVIIDSSETKISEAEELGAFTICADATQDDALERAGVRKAKQLVSLLPTDADNLYVILAAKELNPHLLTVTRAEFAAGEKRLRSAGATKVISPYVIGGQRIADGLLRPYVENFLDLTASSSGSDLVIEEIRIPSSSAVIGKQLGETELPKKGDVIIAALVTPSGETLFNPSRSTELKENMVIIGLGKKDEIRALEQLLLPH